MASRIASSSFSRGADVELRVIDSTAEYAVGSLRDHVLLLWRRKVVQEGALPTRKAFLEAIRDKPATKIGFLTVLEAQCVTAASSDVRTEFAEMLQAYERYIGAAAVTFEGQGFRMTMVRSVITAINLASRTRFPNSVFGDVNAAASWMSQRMASVGNDLDAQRIIAAIDFLRTV
jgi:hypothetical protein